MFDAIVIAGSPNSGPLSECSNEAYEAMIRIGEKPMIRYVVDALFESKLVNNIAISGPKELKDEFPEETVKVAGLEGTVIGNARKALDLVDTTKPVIIATCDIPLLTAKAVRDFVQLSQEEDVDFFYPIVSMDEVRRQFPEIKRTSVKLEEGTFTGGNLFIVNPEAVPRSAAKAQEFVNFRKSPVKLCQLLGLRFVLKLLFSHLTIPELEKKVSEVLDIKVKAVVTMFPEIGIDVDKPSDYSIVSDYLGKPA
ncbi:MAG: nucleotidyltransferase family protein [Eubacteriales bacterium]